VRRPAREALHTGQVRSSWVSRVPALAWAAWGVALAVIAALAVAVTAHLSRPDGMAGHQHAATALSRAGSTPDSPLLGARLVTAWQLDAVWLAVVVCLAAAYLTGVALVGLRNPGRRWPAIRTAAFFAGLAVVVVATCGSIAVYDQVLFSAHMAGHLALVMAAPALIVCGQPLRLALAATEPPARDRLARLARGRIVAVLTAPPVALASYTAVIVGSHLTGLMDEIMRNTWAGQLEHLVYLLAGCQFFVLIVGDEPIRWRLAAPARWLLLAVAMAVDTFTGIVLMQGSRAISMLPATGFTVNAATDTRTGGAMMWFGGDAIMAVVMIGLVAGWLRRADTAHTDEPGWLEQARRTTLAGHLTAPLSDEPGAVDDQDAARASYNEWLAGLSRRR
jgi:cytochrome c oxidase assembly factor CtaG